VDVYEALLLLHSIKLLNYINNHYQCIKTWFCFNKYLSSTYRN